MRTLCLVSVTALVLAGCSGESSDSDADSAEQSLAQEAGESPGETVVLQRSMDPVTVLTAGAESPETASAGVSEALYAASPAVVVAASDDADGISQAADIATEAGVPLLLLDDVASTPTDDTAAQTTEEGQGSADAEDEGTDAESETAEPGDDAEATLDEISRLEATTALAVSSPVAEALDAELDIDIVTEAGDLPDLDEVDGLSTLTVLVQDDDTASQSVATANATAAGATVMSLSEPDVRTSSEAIESISQNEPESVLAVGPAFGTVEQVSAQIEVARTGVELPGGGQTVFPGRRLVALYGHPGTPGLGVLGEQDLEASITRAEELSGQFEPLSDIPTVPTFEIIVTVAQASAGSDGDYSSETPVEELRPWVEKAGEEGVYVILDLQPGRANFLDQAKIYEELLVMPHVGLALDPEWRLTQTQRPLQQIGTVEAAEVNSVIDWLAELTARENLPQKALVLHQFRISMLQDTDQIDVSRDEVAVLIHMDGQGATSEKDGTWQAVVDNAPEGLPMGWKNFYDEDIPMLTPEQTMTREPTPLMISYQ